MNADHEEALVHDCLSDIERACDGDSRVRQAERREKRDTNIIQSSFEPLQRPPLDRSIGTTSVMLPPNRPFSPSSERFISSEQLLDILLNK